MAKELHRGPDLASLSAIDVLTMLQELADVLWWDDDKDLLASAFGKKHSCKSSGYMMVANRFRANDVEVLLDTTSLWTVADAEPVVQTKGDCPQGPVSWPMPGERLPDWMMRDFTLLKRDLDLGSRDPMLPGDHPRGRQFIMIGEWGPLDPTQPGVYPTEGGPTFRVLGADDYGSSPVRGPR